MSEETDPRLLRLLGGEALARLRQRLRRHFERSAPGAPPGLLRLTGLSLEERAPLESLAGQPHRRASSISLDLAALDATLNAAGLACSLRQALERLDGPIINRAEAREATRDRWVSLTDGCRHPDLAGLLAVPAGLGLLKRLSRQDPNRGITLRDGAEAVLCRLPANGLPRAQLAAETLGDAHALDPDRPVSTLVLAAWRHRVGSLALETEGARQTWAQAGVLVNELARPVLFLNLPLEDGEEPFARSGEPAYASLRRLLRRPPCWAVAGRCIHVCENPNLLAIAADQLGSHCAPLVCTDGMPAAAQRTLLDQLTGTGADLVYHGDFDWPGLQIANHVMQRYGAQPWRFLATDYRAALSQLPHHGTSLAGTPVPASWDPDLTLVMQDHRRSIPEECVAALLLNDLLSK